MGKNHKRLFKYAKKMQGESENEAKLKLTIDKKKKISTPT